MRWLPVALLVLSLSGCVAPEEAAEDPLVAVCPQWVEGPDAATGNATAVPGGVALVLEPTRDGDLAALHDGFPLDLYVLEVRSEGPVVARAATTDGRNLLLRDAAAAEPDSRPSLAADGEASWAVYLTAVTHGTPADPSGVVLNLTADAPTEVAVTATPWYRVCGAVVDAPEQRSS